MKLVEGKKYLSDKELIQIQNDDLKHRLCEEKLRSAGLTVSLMEAKQKILCLELGKAKDGVETLRKEEAQAKIKRAENLKALAKKHDLKDGWGYNPDSGEIKD